MEVSVFSPPFPPSQSLPFPHPRIYVRISLESVENIVASREYSTFVRIRKKRWIFQRRENKAIEGKKKEGERFHTKSFLCSVESRDRNVHDIDFQTGNHNNSE